MDFQAAVELIENHEFNASHLEQLEFDIDDIETYYCAASYRMSDDSSADEDPQEFAIVEYYYTNVTLLHIALINNNTEAVNLLCERGASSACGCQYFLFIQDERPDILWKCLAEYENVLELVATLKSKGLTKLTQVSFIRPITAVYLNMKGPRLPTVPEVPEP